MSLKFKDNLTVVILCGGKGKRLLPITKTVPKPLLKINNKEIIHYILEHLKKYNLKKIILATGYRSDSFKKIKSKNLDIKVVNSGINKDIIERIISSAHDASQYILVCYGDTIVDINVDKLIYFHKKFKNKISFSVYKLKSQFGLLKVKKFKISNFKEKPRLEYYFNIGFFLFDKEKLKFMKKFKTFKSFLESNYAKKNLRAYLHNGKHITINTLNELNIAKENLKKF
jgi:NDP-sugar pyrophosphorylase family protein